MCSELAGVSGMSTDGTVDMPLETLDEDWADAEGVQQGWAAQASNYRLSGQLEEDRQALLTGDLPLPCPFTTAATSLRTAAVASLRTDDDAPSLAAAVLSSSLLLRWPLPALM